MTLRLAEVVTIYGAMKNHRFRALKSENSLRTSIFKFLMDHRKRPRRRPFGCTHNGSRHPSRHEAPAGERADGSQKGFRGLRGIRVEMKPLRVFG